MAGMPVARNGDVSIYYEVMGDEGDPPLLIINGLGSQCTNYRVEWCEMFVAEGFRVIRMDNRDVGLSTHFDDVPPDLQGVLAALGAGDPPALAYTLADMADDAVAVLDDLGIGTAHVMGLSMGGMIVQHLAISHADRLRSLTSVMSSTGDPDVGHASTEAVELMTAASPTDRDGYIARTIKGLHTWGSPAWQDDRRTAAIAGEAYDRAFDPAGQARQYLAILSDGSRTAALGSVTVPTLVMHGTADRLVDPSGGQRTAEAIPGARLELIEGMGHDYPPQVWPRWVELVTTHARAADAASAPSTS
jgi:pimeloyl-ACP methyl ester carboxylesterase